MIRGVTMDAKARIKELMTQRGWSIYRLSQESGIAMSTLTNLFRRGQQPTLQTIEVVCEAMELTLPEFFAEGADPSGLTEEQARFFTLWDALTEEQQEAILELLDTMHTKRPE